MIEFDFDNIISKLMAEKILSIIKEKKRIKAIEIANILGTDRKTVNHYLYSDLRRVVEKDQMHYWSLKGRRPKLSSDDVYYLTEYIPKRLWRYKEEEELEDSKLVLRLKENDEVIFKEQINELTYINGLYAYPVHITVINGLEKVDKVIYTVNKDLGYQDGDKLSTVTYSRILVKAERHL